MRINPTNDCFVFWTLATSHESGPRSPKRRPNSFPRSATPRLGTQFCYHKSRMAFFVSPRLRVPTAEVPEFGRERSQCSIDQSEASGGRGKRSHTQRLILTIRPDLFDSQVSQETSNFGADQFMWQSPGAIGCSMKSQKTSDPVAAGRRSTHS